MVVDTIIAVQNHRHHDHSLEDWWRPLSFRSAYPLGLPEEFAFVAVMRMTASTLNKNWNIWQMQDVNGSEQLAVRLDGLSKSLEFTFTALDAGRLHVAFSPVAVLFNDQWHKVLLEVSGGSVTLYVDCAMIGSQTIQAREKVRLDGFTLIGKLKNNPVMATAVRPQPTAHTAASYVTSYIFYFSALRPFSHLMIYFVIIILVKLLSLRSICVFASFHNRALDGHWWACEFLFFCLVRLWQCLLLFTWMPLFSSLLYKYVECVACFGENLRTG